MGAEAGHPPVTVVTALIDLARHDGTDRRRVKDYLETADLVLGTAHEVVAFVEPDLIDDVAALRGRLAPGCPTRIVPCSFEELPMAGTVARIEADFTAGRRPESASNPEKDTPRYLALGWSKPALLARAVGAARRPDQRIWWVDFGLDHVVERHPNRAFDDLLATVDEELVVDVLWVTSRDETADRTAFYRDNRFSRVAGGLFGGSAGAVRELAEWFATEVDRCLATGWPTLEEVIMGAVLADRPDRFSLRYGPWSALVANLDGLHTAAWHPLRLLADCRARALHTRAVELGLTIDEAWRAGDLPLDPEQMVALFDELLVSGWWSGQTDVARMAARQLQLLMTTELTPAVADRLWSERLQGNLTLVDGAVDLL